MSYSKSIDPLQFGDGDRWTTTLLINKYEFL